MKYAVALVWMLWLCIGPALAAETVEDNFTEKYHLEHYRVSINDDVFSTNVAVYLSDEEVIYVSDTDLDAWTLKRPRTASFERNGHRYYGLQTDLNLAASYNRHDGTLEIVAPSSAFLGQPDNRKPIPTIPGRGAFFNYDLNQDNQTYDFYAASQGGIYQLKYQSTTNTEFRFYRSLLRWFQVDSATHRAISIGDGNTNGGWIGSSVPFAGVHYASDFTTDPTYVSRGAPSVSGFATAPSLLEVYINNVLAIQRYVPEGPFTVDGLPTSAASSDIVLVLTDQRGVKTTQEARPLYDPTFLGRGFSEFRLDSGIAEENANLPGQYYRGFVTQGDVRYGLTDGVTAAVLAETINSKNFADVGADVLLAEDDTFGFRIGTGNVRRASEYRLNLQSGKVTFTEVYAFNSQTTPAVEGFDYDNTIQNLSEQSSLNFPLGKKWTFQLSLNRGRSNQGADQSNVASQVSTSIGKFIISLTPMYNFISRKYSANANVNLQLDRAHSLSATSSVDELGQASGAVTWRKSPVDPDDPITMSVKLTAAQSQDKQFDIEDTMPWAVASFNYQQQFDRSIYNPQLRGAIALVGGNLYALQTVGEGESFGILQLPGVSNARVTVNGSDAGSTNGQGWLFLRGLAPYRENSIEVNAADLPIWDNLDDPLHVIPRRSAPIRVTTIVTSGGGFTFEALDKQGVPLPAASLITSGTKRYPVGYGGRVYVDGMAPGTAHFSSLVNDVPCTIEISVPKDTTTIPDLGAQRCLAKTADAPRG
ncbi:MAG: fimbria/pilus outer membrane usher protein [Candidatus Aquilonibacter sp.]